MSEIGLPGIGKARSVGRSFTGTVWQYTVASTLLTSVANHAAGLALEFVIVLLGDAYRWATIYRVNDHFHSSHDEVRL